MHDFNFWHWFIDFIGVNNGENAFSTHMYNFWSGFGGNAAILALVGVLVAIYRQYHKYLGALDPTNVVRKPLDLVHKKPRSTKSK